MILVVFFMPGAVSGVSLNPAKQTIVIRPGKTEMINFEIVNDANTAKKFIAEIDGFKIDEMTGRPIFGVRDEAISWITPLQNEITIAPAAKKIFSFKVSAPEKARTGGHYLALFAKEKSAGSEIGVNSRVGSLLFLYVEGVIREELSVASFKARKSYSFSGPVKLDLVLKNNGNIHLVPDGQIIVQDYFGNNVEKININELERKILPGQSWIGEYSLPLARAVGPIKAQADITYGLTNQKLSGIIEFWRIPGKTISLLVGIILLVPTIYLIRVKIKKNE